METGAKSLVYTNEKCIGCNKCISVCASTGACVSREVDGKNRIDVDGDKCVGCGACFDVCEHGAREYCDDTERFFEDLSRGEKISILVAPAFKANYPGEYVFPSPVRLWWVILKDIYPSFCRSCFRCRAL